MKKWFIVNARQGEEIGPFPTSEEAGGMAECLSYLRHKNALYGCFGFQVVGKSENDEFQQWRRQNPNASEDEFYDSDPEFSRKGYGYASE